MAGVVGRPPFPCADSLPFPRAAVNGSQAHGRRPADRRPALFPWLTALSGIALMTTPLLDQVWLVTAVWTLAGVGTALQLIANAAFVQAVPPHLRGRAFGVAGTLLMATQGLVLLAAGGLADLIGPGSSVALMAAGGLVLLALRRRPRVGGSQVGDLSGRGLAG